MSSAYDRVAYPDGAFPQSHPDRLATLGTLFGLQPAPPARCRVLELGCGAGANLLPMAAAFPASHFIGIDLAQAPIEAARERMRTLGLDNITFECVDIGAFEATPATFDYIIAHGVYSWVPADVRRAILEICRASLAAHGIAYISYNTYPGGHVRDMARDMMQFHVAHLADTSQQAAEARALLQFVAQARAPGDPYRTLLEAELERMNDGGDAYVYHDDLATTNTPFYFHEFIADATACDLGFLAEAEYSQMQNTEFAPSLAASLRQLTGESVELREQYADFITCRKFRQTLLCRRERSPRGEADPAALAHCAIAAPLTSAAGRDDVHAPSVEVSFTHPRGPALTSEHAWVKIALSLLGAKWPCAMPFPELVDAVYSDSGADGTADAVREVLAGSLLQAYARGVVDIHVQAPAITARPGEFPVASRLARVQARTGKRVVNLRHETIELEGELARRLLGLLDGSRDRDALLAGLATSVGGHDSPAAREVLRADLDAKLLELARLALLER